MHENNNGKNSFLRKLANFLGEKGFYVVLFLCVGVIGVTAWLFSTAWNSTKPQEDESLSAAVTAPPTDGGGSDGTEAMAGGRWGEDLAGSGAERYSFFPEEPAPPATAAPKGSAEAEDGGSGQAAPAEAVPVDAPPPDDAGKPVAEAMALVFLWPVNGSVETPHAMETLTYDRTMADWRTHNGVDIAAALGAKVSAAADGSVEQFYTDELYGTTLVIYHGGGLRSVYSNLAPAPTVLVGDEVRMGDVIGAVGKTALAEAGDVNHLHFAMTLDDAHVDPLDYLPAR